jgi:hypothetical protein
MWDWDMMTETTKSTSTTTCYIVSGILTGSSHFTCGRYIHQQQLLAAQRLLLHVSPSYRDLNTVTWMGWFGNPPEPSHPRHNFTIYTISMPILPRTPIISLDPGHDTAIPTRQLQRIDPIAHDHIRAWIGVLDFSRGLWSHASVPIIRSEHDRSIAESYKAR